MGPQICEGLPNPHLGAHQRGHATTRFLEGFLDGSLQEVLLGSVLRKHLVRGFSRERGS